MDDEQQLAADAVLRRARPGDEDGILECIRALATYEKEPDAVETTADGLREALFGRSPSVFAHVVARRERIVGIAVWFLNYSTWTGRGGIYLEDLFVYADERGHGYGKALLRRLARLCAERGYRRLEWSGWRPADRAGPPGPPGLALLSLGDDLRGFLAGTGDNQLRLFPGVGDRLVGRLLSEGEDLGRRRQVRLGITPAAAASEHLSPF
jgi:GNAT superfamily N-acetyltransferase